MVVILCLNLAYKIQLIKKIYLPWHGFNNRFDEGLYVFGDFDTKLQQKALELARNHYNYGPDRFDKLPDSYKKLHGRNAFQCAGLDLNTPSKFLICWTPDGEIIGGTATSINISLVYGIPVFNLSKEEDLKRINKFLY